MTDVGKLSAPIIEPFRVILKPPKCMTIGQERLFVGPSRLLERFGIRTKALKCDWSARKPFAAVYLGASTGM